MRTRWHAAALVACIAGALVTPLGGRAVSRACAASAVHVAIVVDTGSGSSVSAVCVPAGSRDNGSMLLAARASMLGTPQPRYGSSGLLCAIDGFPATGCGDGQNGTFAYWSYWHGGNGAWTYATTGPASTRVDPAIVEGWRWHPESAGTTTSPPRVAPVASTICKPTPPPAPPPTTAAATTRTTVRAAGGAPATTIPPQGPGPAGTIAAPRRSGVTGTTAPPTTDMRAHAPGDTAKPRGAAASSKTTAPGASATVAPTTIALAQRGIATEKPASDSGGVPIGLILGGVLVAVLFTVGGLAARRRRSTA